MLSSCKPHYNWFPVDNTRQMLELFCMCHAVKTVVVREVISVLLVILFLSFRMKTQGIRTHTALEVCFARL